MPEIITAVYENGVLRPLNPLSLQEHQTVRIQVLTEEPAMDAEQIIQSLVAAGLVSPPRRGDVEPVSEEAWRELTQRLEAFPSKPLSEIIIEERGFNVTAYFLDSSALVKRYVPETGSAWIRAISALDPGNSLIIARITWVEVRSALARRQREGSLTISDAILITQRFRFDLIRVKLRR